MGGSENEGARVLCSVCLKSIDTEEEYIEATCNGCGQCTYHVECVTPLMSRVHHDSTRAQERARHLVANKPHFYMAEQKLRCPAALAGPSDCGGKIVDADMIKPIKAAPAPPPGLPAPAFQKRGKKGTAGNAAPGNAAPGKAGRSGGPRKQGSVSGAAAGAAGAAALPAPPSKRQLREQNRAAAAALRATAAPDYAAASASGGGSSGGGGGGGGAHGMRGGAGQPRGSKLKFPSMQRPPELQRCQDWDDYGECFIHKCSRCHGEEELQERERAWASRQKANEREQREHELRRHESAVAARAEQSEWELQVAARERERLEHEEAYLQMGDAPLRLMKDHKRSFCVAQLLDMGFDASLAAAAADASGCDVSIAAALLMEGALLMGAKPVSVTGEAQELLAYAASLGLGLSDVELALVLSRGDWDQARMQLHEQAEATAIAASAGDAAVAAQVAVTVGSREEAELAAALEASSSGAAMAYNTARQAAAAASAAREAAELAAALDASRAQQAAEQQYNRFQQQTPVLPWATHESTAVAAAPGAVGSRGDAGAVLASRVTAASDSGWGGAPAAATAASASARSLPPLLQPQQEQQAGSSVGGGLGGGGNGSLWYYDESAKNGMPEYRGGWDVGPAAVAAAASGQSSSTAASYAPQQPPVPAADPWHPLKPTASGQQLSSSMVSSTARIPHPASAASISSAVQPDSWNAAVPLPPSAPHSAAVVGGAATGHGHGAGYASGLAAAAAAPAAAGYAQQHAAAGHSQQHAAAYSQQAPVSVTFSPAASPSTPIGGWGRAQQAQQQATPAQQPDGAAEIDELMQLMGIA